MLRLLKRVDATGGRDLLHTRALFAQGVGTGIGTEAAVQRMHRGQGAPVSDSTGSEGTRTGLARLIPPTSPNTHLVDFRG